MGHYALWNASLNAPSIAEIFDGKHVIDLTTNFGNYTAAGNLQHYWRPGYNDEGFTDEAPLASPAMDFTDSVDITIADIVEDAPS
jgi:hypothetical protein